MPKRLGKLTNISPMWLFPVLTLVAAIYLLRDTFKDRGPLITIHFPEANNIEAGKSELRYRGVRVGVVEDIYFAAEFKEVTVKARLQKSAASLSKEKTKFLIVQPRISLQGIQGLDTIISGSYIRIEPGGGDESKEFKGQVAGDESDIEANTVSFTIRSPQLHSLHPGDPVTYRGLAVGTVHRVALTKTGQWIDIRIAIEARHRHLIRANTVFWRASGIQANLGLFSSKIDISSMEAVMKGALAFATPTQSGALAKEGTAFNLLPEAPQEWIKWSPVL